MNPLDQYSEALISLCQKYQYHPNLEDIQKCVDDGALVYVEDVDAMRPVLNGLILAGEVDAVRICLSSKLPINFTFGGMEEQTPLHAACFMSVSDEHTAAILDLIVERIQTHPEDQIDWGKPNFDGQEVLSFASKYQKISILWPRVREFPYYSDRTAPFSFPYVWSTDWNTLLKEYRNDEYYFDLQKSKVREVDCHTSNLMKLCWKSSDVQAQDPSVYAGLVDSVRSGANVLIRAEYDWPLLHWVIGMGRIVCLRAMLQTTQPLDFSELFSAGPHSSVSALGQVCVCGPEESAASLSLILDRLESPIGNSDTVNWDSFLSTAASLKLLSVLYPILKSYGVPYFLEHKLDLVVHQEDWDQLSDQEKNDFGEIRFTDY